MKLHMWCDIHKARMVWWHNRYKEEPSFVARGADLWGITRGCWVPTASLQFSGGTAGIAALKHRGRRWNCMAISILWDSYWLKPSGNCQVAASPPNTGTETWFFLQNCPAPEEFVSIDQVKSLKPNVLSGLDVHFLCVLMLLPRIFKEFEILDHL